MQRIQSDSSIKEAYGQSLILTVYYNQVSTRSSHYTFCTEVFMTLPLVIYTRKDFFLLDAFNEKIEMLRAGGLIDFWKCQIIDKRFLNTKAFVSPKVMTMYQLLGCFEVLCIGCAMSLIGFCGEILWWSLRKYRTIPKQVTQV